MHVMIIEIYNDDIDQRKCPKPIPHKSPGRFHTRIWPKIQKNQNFLNHLKCIVDVLFILFETSNMQKLCGERTECFEVTTSSPAASNKICIRFNMKA